MKSVSELVGTLTPSPTGNLDSRVKALRASGEPIISFGAGEPNFPTPDHIVEAAVRACSNITNHKYSPAQGLAELREAIAANAYRDTGLEVSPDEVLVTNGGKHAVATSLATLLNPGDEVLIPAPYWTTYPQAVHLARGKAVPVMSREANHFRISVDELEGARTSNTKLLIFVSPSNPTGAVIQHDDIADIGQWAAENDIWVLCDEIYQHFVYGGAVNFSLPVVAPEVADRWIVVNGVSKTYAMTGWRVGWMISSPEVIKAAVGYQSHTTSNISNVSQRAALEALVGDQSSVEEMRSAFNRRRLIMTSKLNAIDGVSCVAPEGAFYCFPNVTQLIGRRIQDCTVESSAALANLLLDKIQIAVVPGEAFGSPGYLRFSYALDDLELAEGLERFSELVKGD